MGKAVTKVDIMMIMYYKRADDSSNNSYLSNLM